MKNKASVFLKHIISVLSSIAKARSIAIKSKTTTMKARLIIFSLMKNKKVLLGSITHKFHNLLGHHQDKREEEEEEVEVSDQSKAIVLYNALTSESHSNYPSCTELMKVGEDYDDDEEEEDVDDKYPDLTHSLFESDELDFVDQCGSVIDYVRNSKEEEGEDFSLEDEIDHVADLFIKKFHRQMKMQKLASFKRYQEMLERSV